MREERPTGTVTSRMPLSVTGMFERTLTVGEAWLSAHTSFWIAAGAVLLRFNRFTGDIASRPSERRLHVF